MLSAADQHLKVRVGSDFFSWLAHRADVLRASRHARLESG
jgi:hypothetical protein